MERVAEDGRTGRARAIDLSMGGAHRDGAQGRRAWMAALPRLPRRECPGRQAALSSAEDSGHS